MKNIVNLDIFVCIVQNWGSLRPTTLVGNRQKKKAFINIGGHITKVNANR